MNNNCEKHNNKLMALLDGTLDDNAERILKQHIEACPNCKSELQWLEVIHKDLEAIGDAIVENLPEIDVVSGVMNGVIFNENNKRIAHLESLKTRKRSWWPMGLGIAAAAATLILGIGLGIFVRPYTDETKINITRNTIEEGSGTIEDSPNGTGENNWPKVNDIKPELEPHLPWIKNIQRKRNGDSPEASDTVENDPSRGEKLELAVLASYTNRLKDRASEIADSLETSIKAKVGVTRHLPAENAEQILLEASKDLPNDPHLVYQLAMNYAENPETAAEALAQLEILKEIDPNNAIPFYIEAKVKLEQGDTDGALSALDNAIKLEQANAYADAAFPYNEEALIASGLTPDEAMVLAAFSIGSNEYDDLQYLASTLLDYGTEFYDTNPSATRQIYESVDRMGEQLQNDPQHLEEAMAGANIQTLALTPLESLYAAQEDQAAQDAIKERFDATNMQMELFADIIGEVAVTVSRPNVDIVDIAGGIIRGGFSFLYDLTQNARDVIEEQQ